MKRLYWIPAFALLALGLLAGCGSEVDEDWTPVNAQDTKHEFGAISNHDDYLAGNNYAFDQCTECHGEDLHGLDLGDPDDPVRSCFDCHGTTNHNWVFDGFAVTSAHAQWMRDNGWQMDECATCHTKTAADATPSGVEFGAGCADAAGCHANEYGPEACNTCHGDFGGNPDDKLNWATSGAHATHLTGNPARYASFSCEVCHVVPAEIEADGHYNDDTPGMVEVIFGGTAADSEGEYDGTNESCSNVYCHGENDLTWDLQNVTFTCTSCHGFPPAVDHPQISNCGQCHDTVSDSNPAEIVSPDLHMNGSVD